MNRLACLLMILLPLLAAPARAEAVREMRYLSPEADLLMIADLRAARQNPAAWELLEEYLPPAEIDRVNQVQRALGLDLRRDGDRMVLFGPGRRPEAMVGALAGRFDQRAIVARASRMPGYRTGKLSGLQVHAVPAGGGTLIAFPEPGSMLLASQYTSIEKAIATGARGGAERRVGGGYPAGSAPVLWIDGLQPDLAALALPPAIAAVPLDRATLGLWMNQGRSSLDGRLRARDAESANRIALGLRGLGALSWMQGADAGPLEAALAAAQVRVAGDGRDVLVSSSAPLQ